MLKSLCSAKHILKLTPHEEVLLSVGSTARKQYSPSMGVGTGLLEMALLILMAKSKWVHTNLRKMNRSFSAEEPCDSTVFKYVIHEIDPAICNKTSCRKYNRVTVSKMSWTSCSHWLQLGPVSCYHLSPWSMRPQEQMCFSSDLLQCPQVTVLCCPLSSLYHVALGSWLLSERHTEPYLKTPKWRTHLCSW